MEDGVTFGRIDFDGREQFAPLGRELGVRSFGMNLISLQPGQQLRIHRHARQEEVYVVLRGTLTLSIERDETSLVSGRAARVAPSVKRQLANLHRELCVVLAIGGAGVHESRDGEAFTGWDEASGRPPHEVSLPADLPL